MPASLTCEPHNYCISHRPPTPRQQQYKDRVRPRKNPCTQLSHQHPSQHRRRQSSLAPAYFSGSKGGRTTKTIASRSVSAPDATASACSQTPKSAMREDQSNYCVFPHRGQPILQSSSICRITQSIHPSINVLPRQSILLCLASHRFASCTAGSTMMGVFLLRLTARPANQPTRAEAETIIRNSYTLLT